MRSMFSTVPFSVTLAPTAAQLPVLAQHVVLRVDEHHRGVGPLNLHCPGPFAVPGSPSARPAPIRTARRTLSGRPAIVTRPQGARPTTEFGQFRGLAALAAGEDSPCTISDQDRAPSSKGTWFTASLFRRTRGSRAPAAGEALDGVGGAVLRSLRDGAVHAGQDRGELGGMPGGQRSRICS